MAIKMFINCFLLLFTYTTTTTMELSYVRQNYISAAVSEEHADAFYKSLEKISSQDSHTLLAYKAASIVLLAKYEGGLVSKMRFFNQGTDLLENTIKKAPDNYEARLIRLNIQDNVPWITGYTSNIKADKAFLINNYQNQPDDLKAFTKKYVLQSGAFSQKEKAVFN